MAVERFPSAAVSISILYVYAVQKEFFSSGGAYPYLFHCTVHDSCLEASGD